MGNITITAMTSCKFGTALEFCNLFQMNDPALASIIRNYGADFEARDEAGRTPLMTAVWASKFEICHYMLETIGVSPNAADFQVTAQYFFSKIRKQGLQSDTDQCPSSKSDCPEKRE